MPTPTGRIATIYTFGTSASTYPFYESITGGSPIVTPSVSITDFEFFSIGFSIIPSAGTPTVIISYAPLVFYTGKKYDGTERLVGPVWGANVVIHNTGAISAPSVNDVISFHPPTTEAVRITIASDVTITADATHGIHVNVKGWAH